MSTGVEGGGLTHDGPVTFNSRISALAGRRVAVDGSMLAESEAHRAGEGRKADDDFRARAATFSSGV